MNSRQRFDRLEFDNNFSIYDEVRSERLIKLNAIVHNRHGFLTFNHQSSLAQLVREHHLVNRFKDSRPELGMDHKGSVENLLCNFVFSHPPWTFVTFVSFA